MDTIFLGILTISVVINLWIMVKYIKELLRITNGKPINKDTQVKLSHDEVISILDSLILKCFLKRKGLYYDLQNLKIYDVEKELNFLTKEVRNALSDSFIDNFTYYYHKDYLLSYIATAIEIYLVDDIKKRRQ